MSNTLCNITICVVVVPIPPTTLLLPDSTTVVLDVSSMIETTTMIPIVSPTATIEVCK